MRPSFTLLSADSKATRRILARGLFDPHFYSAQTGTSAESPEAALKHYLAGGADQGFLPHPLVDSSLAHQPARGARLAEAMASAENVASHEFSTAFDWTGYVAQHPEAPAHPGGVVGHFASTERRPEDAAAVLHASGEPVDLAAWRHRTTRHAATMSLALASGIFDAEYYQAQTGVTFCSTRAALWHFLTVGEDQGLAPNPLFEGEWYDLRRETTGEEVFADYLESGASTSPHPHFDPATYRQHVASADDDPGGPLGHFLRHATEQSTTFPVDHKTAPRVWSELRAQLFAGAAAFAEQQRLTAWGSPQPWDAEAERAFHASTEASDPAMLPTISVVFDLDRATGRTRHRIESMLDDHPGLEIIAVAGEDDDRLAGLDPRVLAEITSSASHAARINSGIARSTGDYVHVWHPRDTVRAGFYRRSATALKDADTSFVYSATTTTKSHDALVSGEPFLRDGLVWGDHQAVTRTAVVARSLLDRMGGYDEELDAFADWDFVLRASAVDEPVFLPQIGLVADARRVGVRKSHRGVEHLVRADELCDWETSVDARVPGRVSILIPVFEDWSITVRALDAIVATTEGRDVEAVLLDNGSRRAVGALITASHGHETRVRLRRVPRNTNFATGSNLAFLASSGSRVVFMNNDTIPTPGWLDPLLAAIDDPAVRAAQPLLLFDDRTVQTAGTVFHARAFPWHFLQGHPVEDVLSARETRFSAITAAVMACRAAEIHAMRGFDPIYVNGMEDVDLCLRLARAGGGDFRVVLDSVVVHAESQTRGRFNEVGRNRARFMERWAHDLPPSDLARYESAGLLAPHYRANRSRPGSHLRTGSVVVVRPPRLVGDGPAHGLPSLRWAVKTSAIPGPDGDAAEDAQLADAVGYALRSLGQDVVIDRQGSHQRPSSDHLDDVVLVLRRGSRIDAQPGTTNVLWIVGDPTDVPDEEIAAGFDVVHVSAQHTPGRSDGPTPRIVPVADGASVEHRAMLLLADVLDVRDVPHDLRDR